MKTYAAIAIVLLACQTAPAAQPSEQPPAQPAQADSQTPRSIVPKFDLKRTTTYTITSKSTTSGAKTLRVDGDKDTTNGATEGDWTCQVRVRALRTDARTDQTEIAVEFLTFKGQCTDAAGRKAAFDTSKRFVPQPVARQRSKGGHKDPDGEDYNGVPYDRLIDEHFRPMTGAKVLLRVDSRGRILSTVGGEALNKPNVGCPGMIEPHPVLQHLFGPVSLNNDKASSGLVKEGDRWTYDRVSTGTTKSGAEPTTTITNFVVRKAGPGGVEIDGDGALQPRANGTAGNTSTRTEKSSYVWDPATGELVRATQTFDMRSDFDKGSLKGNYQSRAEITIERVEPAKPESVKPPADAAKPRTPGVPTAPSR
jgi:hypothetical protein